MIHCVKLQVYKGSEVIFMQIGFIGIGNMGEAILRGALRGGLVLPSRVSAYDPNTAKLNLLQQELGVVAAADAEQLVAGSDIILLAVKPNVCASVLSRLAEPLAGKALISIAAGWSQQRLANLLPDSVRVLRVMPNTPALVGCGMSVFECGDTLSADEKTFAEKLFASIGHVTSVESRLMDAVTAVSGSGPAYVYMFIEALADGGVREGLPRALAYELAAQTVCGGAEMVLQTAAHPGVLKDNVCSPGGTTIEAVAALEEKGMRSAVLEAVRVCAVKSALMSK